MKARVKNYVGSGVVVGYMHGVHNRFKNYERGRPITLEQDVVEEIKKHFVDGWSLKVAMTRAGLNHSMQQNVGRITNPEVKRMREIQANELRFRSGVRGVNNVDEVLERFDKGDIRHGTRTI